MLYIQQLQRNGYVLILAINMSGYLTQNGTDLSDIFKPITTSSNQIVNSTGTGITITSTTGPLTLQQNALSQPINIQTAIGSTASINLTCNNINMISVGNTQITMRTPSGITTLITDLSGSTCNTNFNYGPVDITPTASSTYTLLASSPRDLYIYGTNSFTLTFPSNPPFGTSFRIIRLSTTGTMTLSGGTFQDAQNATLSSTILGASNVFRFVFYSSRWYCSPF